MRRIILGFLTIIVLLVSVGPALLNSLEEPQIANRLELYQTDLILQAREAEPPEGLDVEEMPGLLGGTTSLEDIANQYETTLQSVQENLQRLQGELVETRQPPIPDQPLTPEPGSDLLPPTPEPQAPSSQIEKNIWEQQVLNYDLGLRLGILYAVQGNEEKAIAIWEPIAEREVSAPITSSPELLNPMETAQVLIGLWNEPPQILPNAESRLQQSLTGWFRFRALEQLYELQQRPDALDVLEVSEQEQAQETLVKLGLLGVGPALGMLVGAGMLVVLIAQRILKGKDALLAENESLSWITPWPWDITWQVLIVGFFFVGQIIVPVTVSLSRSIFARIWINQGLNLTLSSSRATAITTAIIYLLMAIATILVLYLSIKPFLPLPSGWFRVSFRGRWFLWGLGGYLVAVPLVIGISLINQQIWQGRGGSNPLLEIVLQEGDALSLGIFFFTAAIAAPIFEEILFRGFLLPSLTRYMSVWGAIALSAVIFATAHLSFSEVLPLTILGVVLGFVYTRSRNLLASMMVHSLWNSATMIGLLILGSSID